MVHEGEIPNIKGPNQAAFCLYPINIVHWTESYIRFSLSCQVIQSCSQAWKGHNDDDLLRPALDSRFCSLSCFFLILCYFKSPTEGDRCRRHLLWSYSQAPVKIGYIKVTRAKGYFTHDINGGGDNMYTADNICKMIEFLIDNIFVQFGGRLFRQVIGIPMGTHCAPLLADLFLYSYENEFLDNMIRSGHRRLARSFNLCYRYIDDLIVFNNKKFLWIISKRYIHHS